MALVERKNYTIGKIIHRILTQAELAERHSSQWVDILPLIIVKINEKVTEIESQKPKSQPSFDNSITADPNTKINMLKVGDEVRVALDSPIDVNGNKLQGKFRVSDIRWNPKVRTIRRVLLKPNQPIMYMLDGPNGDDLVGNVAYTYNQLQKVSSRENIERESVVQVEENRFEVKNIIDKKIKDGQTYYLVHWKNERKNKSTWESRKALVEDLGEAYMNRVDKKLNNNPNPKIVELQNNDDNYFEIEDILDKKKFGKVIKYLVKWVGYSHEFNTWEPRKNLIEDLGIDTLNEYDRKFN